MKIVAMIPARLGSKRIVKKNLRLLNGKPLISYIIESAKMGADVVTIPPATFRQLFKHPLTENGLQAFLDDCASTGQSIL